MGGEKTVSVTAERPDQPGIERLLDLSDAVAARLYPGAFRQPITAETLRRADVTLLVARATRRAAHAAARPCSTCPTARSSSSA